jgi:hypothetical protein
MNGRKIISRVLLFSLLLSAFRPPQQLRPDPNAKMILQFLAVIHTDGSAELHYIIKDSKAQVAQNLKNGNYPEDEMCAKTTSGIENNIGAFTQEKHGDEIWCTYTITMDNLKGLSNHLEDKFSLTVQRLEILDNKFFLDLTWHDFPCTTTSPADFTCEFSVQAPGQAGPNNATRVQGNTLTWDMMDGKINSHFTAESAVGGFDSTVWIALAVLMCGCCAVVVLIGGGLAAYLILRNRKAAQSVPDFVAGPGPSSPPGASPQP